MDRFTVYFVGEGEAVTAGETVGVAVTLGEGVTIGEVVAVGETVVLAVGVGDVVGVAVQPVRSKTASRRKISFLIVFSFIKYLLFSPFIFCRIKKNILEFKMKFLHIPQPRKY